MPDSLALVKMEKLNKLYKISTEKKGLLLLAASLLIIVRISLFAFPFKMLIKRIESLQNKKQTYRATQMFSCENIGWAVRVASRYMPFAKCLTQALAVKLLLIWQACPGQLCIGVSKNNDGMLEAHAWVESDGQIVIGGQSDISRFRPLPPIMKNVPSRCCPR